MKLIANVCMYNEVEKGNLKRCLDNLKYYCDDIVIWDDASTDNSVDVASTYTPYILSNGVNDQMNELAHKQTLLDYSIELGATHVFWLDCDEVVDSPGTLFGMRKLCEEWPEGIDAFSFHERNLWRSERWVRVDSLFDIGWFVRLWKIQPGIRFKIQRGVHKQLYPCTVRNILKSPYDVIHYGFHDYNKMLVKIGAHLWTKEDWLSKAADNWILNETACECFCMPFDRFPPGCKPLGNWVDKPLPKTIEELKTYTELMEAK